MRRGDVQVVVGLAQGQQSEHHLAIRRWARPFVRPRYRRRVDDPDADVGGAAILSSPMVAPKEYRVHGTGQLADMDGLVGLEVGLLLDRNLAPEVLLQSLGL